METRFEIIEKVKKDILNSSDIISTHEEMKILDKFLSWCYDNGWFSNNVIRDDGCYIELFAVKNGLRYNAKVINLKDATQILTNSLMDGVEKLWRP